MKKEFLAHFPHTAWTAAGLILFLTVFLLAVLWVYRRGSTDFYRGLADLPLELPLNTPTHNQEHHHVR